MTSRVVVAGAALAGAALIGASVVGAHRADAPKDGRGGWSAVCEATGQLEAVDPVVAHGVTPSAHLHQFFGATGLTPDTTFDDLRLLPNTCSTVPDPENMPDHNALWAPALFKSPDKAEAIHAAHLVYYFRTGDVDPTTITVPPEGFNFVAGNSRAMIPGDNPHAQWACTSVPGLADESPTIPETCPVVDAAGNQYRLRLTIQSPSCYLGDVVPGAYNYGKPAVDRLPALVYPDPPVEGERFATCPAGYQPIGRVDLTIRYFMGRFPRLDNGTPDDPADDSWDLTGATLASDEMEMTMPDGTVMLSGTDGVTAHADFMSGYTLAENTQLVDDCFHARRNCGIVSGIGE